VTLVLDAGALIGLEGNDQALWRRVKRATTSGSAVATHGGVVAQVWRGGARRARLSMALRAVVTVPLDEELGHRPDRL